MTVDDHQRMRALLRDVDFPEPRLDVATTIRTGQRRRAGRWAATTAAGVGVLVAAAATVQLAPWDHPRGPDRSATRPTPATLPAALDCTVEPLPPPNGRTSAVATGIDPTGRYVIGMVDNDGSGPPRSVLWTDGQPQLLPAGASGEEAVNASGVVVGTLTTGAGGHAWIFRDGQLRNLPVPAGSEAGEVSINTRGDVAGVLYHDGTRVPIVWPADRPGSYRILASPGGGVIVRGITDSGVVVGGMQDGPPYRWEPNGTGSPMATPPGLTTGWVIDVAGTWAVGYFEERQASTDSAHPTPTPTPGHQAAVRWNLATGQATALGFDALPAAIDAAGRVLIPESPPRLVGPDGTMRALPAVAGYVFAHAAGISDNGTVAGFVATDDKDPAAGPYRSQSVRWSCPV